MSYAKHTQLRSARFFIALALFTFHFSLFTLTGCVPVNPECELVLMPRLMVAPGSDPKTPTYGARAYAFYIEGRDRHDPATKEWAPASWEDAEAGMITNSRTGETRMFNLAAEQTANENIALTVSRSPVLMVVVESGGRMWARKVVDYMVPLPRLYLELRFERQRTVPYTDLEWIVEKSEN